MAEQLPSDGKLLQQPGGCTWSWQHLWSKWSDRAEGVHKWAEKIQGQMIIQERRCLKCNAVQLRNAKS